MIRLRIILFYKFGLDLCGLEEFHVKIVDLFHLSFDIDVICESQDLLHLHDFLVKLMGLFFKIVLVHSIIADGLILSGFFEIFEVVAIFGFNFLWQFNFYFTLLFHLPDQLMQLFQVVLSYLMVVFSLD